MKQCLKQCKVNNSKKKQKSRYTTAFLLHCVENRYPFVQHSVISNRNTSLGVCMLKRLSALCRRK